MAYQTGKPVKVPAKGDARNTGAPGFTPAPTSPPSSAELALRRDAAYGRGGYGSNAYAGASSAEPGVSVTSPLADRLRAKAAAGDADLLSDIIRHGTSRDSTVDLKSSQTRPYTNEQHVETNPGTKGASAGPQVPQKLGQSAAPVVRKPQ